jgi:hypothetical protein
MHYRNKTNEQDEQNTKNRTGTTGHGKDARLSNPDHLVIWINAANSTMMRAHDVSLREITKGLGP